VDDALYSENATMSLGVKCTESTLEGFRLFKIDATAGISESFSIAHNQVFFESGGCYPFSPVVPRSVVFGTVVMTMKGHTVMNHDLVTKAEVVAPLDLDGNRTDCGLGDFGDRK
jgi:hypothetical protein